MTEEQKEAQILDLDTYRKKREAIGTWPPASGTDVEWWREFLRSTGRLKPRIR